MAGWAVRAAGRHGGVVMVARSVHSRLRGHSIHYDGVVWRYVDTDEATVGNRRSCGYCGLPDTPEGHDGCLGTLPGVTNACCGHGEPGEAYMQYIETEDDA